MFRSLNDYDEDLQFHDSESIRDNKEIASTTGTMVILL